MYPIPVASELDTIAKTLDTLMTVDLPRLVILFGLLLIAVIIIIVLAFWRILNNYSRSDSQQLQLTAQTMTNLNDYLRTERETNRVKLDLALQEIRKSHDLFMNGIATQNTAIEGLANRIKEVFSILDATIDKIEKRAIESEAHATDQRQQMLTLSEGLQKDMSEVKDGNQEILSKLDNLIQQVKRVADNMEHIDWEQFAAMPTSINTTMKSITDTVNKLTQTTPIVSAEPDETE